MAFNVTAVVADDHALLRDGVKQIIESIEGLKVIAEAADGLTAIAMVKQHQPALLSLDMSMPYAHGLEIYGEVRRWSPHTKIVIFTGLTGIGLLSELISAGVDGLFLKRGDPERLAKAIPLILDGGKVIAPEILELLRSAPEKTELTVRELQILSLIGSGLSNRDIADRLGVSAKTVDNHRTNLMRKLDVHSVAELLAYAHREGLIDPSS